MKDVVILGQFPPPYTGQAIATRTLGETLSEGRGAVVQANLDVQVGNAQSMAANVHRHVRRLNATLRARRRIAKAHFRNSVVIYTNLSPTRIGHARDRLLLGGVREHNKLVGVSHWGNFAPAITRNGIAKASADWFASGLAVTVVLSEVLREDLLKAVPAARVTVIPNTARPEVVNPSSAVRAAIFQANPTKQLRLMFVGAMMESKGYRQVRDSLLLLPPRVVATFIGGWASKLEYEAFVRENEVLGLQHRVRVLDRITDPGQLRDEFSIHDILVLPSTHAAEAQPLVILEAMANGLTVVATAVGGVAELARGSFDDQLLSSPTSEAVADCVSSILWKSDLSELRRAALDSYEKHYSNQVVLDRWLELLESI